MECAFTIEKISETKWRHTCSTCSASYVIPSEKLRANCRGAGFAQRQDRVDPEKQIKGPGDYLHDALIDRFGESPSEGCQCKRRINQMNAWGTEICRRMVDTIVGWLVEEAGKRSWWSKLAVKIPVLPQVYLRRLVLDAIEKAESTASAAKSA